MGQKTRLQSDGRRISEAVRGGDELCSRVRGARTVCDAVCRLLPRHEVRKLSSYRRAVSSLAQDDRTYWGGRVYYNLVFGDMASLTVGGETRQDSGEAQQYNTVNRQRTTTTYDYDMRLSNWAMFLQGQIKPAEYFKIVGGVRWDYFRQDFDNLARPQNSGHRVSVHPVPEDRVCHDTHHEP